MFTRSPGRRGKTNLIMLAQLRDSSGKTWRTHGRLKSNTWTQSAFVLPGDYELALAAFDPDHKDYSFTCTAKSAPLR